MIFAFKNTVRNAKFQFLAFVTSKSCILEAKTRGLPVTKARNGQKLRRDNDPPTGGAGGLHL